jgi:hypothetical protein
MIIKEALRFMKTSEITFEQCQVGKIANMEEALLELLRVPKLMLFILNNNK